MVTTLILCLAVRVTSTVVEQTECIVNLAAEVTVHNGLFVSDDVLASVLDNLCLIAADAVVPAVIRGRTRGIVVGTVGIEPCPRTGIADPILRRMKKKPSAQCQNTVKELLAHLHIVIVKLLLFKKCVSLCGLTAHRVAGNHDLVELGEDVLVEEPICEVIDNVVRR